MLDLKAKLAAAGLVSQTDIDRADAAKRKKSRPQGQRSGPPGAKPSHPPGSPQLPIVKLRGKPKGEIYDAVRRWVDRVRIDGQGGAPSEEAKNFHFPTAAGKIGRLVLEPDVAAQLEDGRCGVVAYMSNHGLAHAVVPADAAKQLVELMPLWLRVLVGDERAGQIEP